jgi:enoyl-CoA hydratase/carnithine racemase
MEYRHIIYEKKDKIATITFNRPEVLNAMNDRMMLEIGTALKNVEKDKKIRLLIITGNDKAFCAGSDLKSINKKIKTLVDQKEYFDYANRNVRDAIEHLSKPVLAVVRGYAVAGGLTIILACDFVIASEDAIIGDRHIKFGLVGPGGEIPRLARVVGVRKAKEIFLTGKTLSGKEAEQIGLVNRAVPRDMIDSAVAELATELVNNSPTAMRIYKDLLFRTIQTDYATAEQLEVSSSLLNMASEDYQKGMKAFQARK